MSRKAANRTAAVSTTTSRIHSLNMHRSMSHRQIHLFAAAAVLFVLLVCHLTLFRRVAQLGSLVCQQHSPAVLEMDALLDLQHLKNKKMSLQSDLARHLSLEHLQLAASDKKQDTVSQEHATHALTTPLTLFIGVLSRSPQRRQLSREGWISRASTSLGWTAKFVIQANNSANQEQEQHGDLLLTGDQSSLHQTLFMMQYALVHFNVQFIMKAQDSSYINVANLLQVLQASCTSASCHNEGVYLGREVKNSSVIIASDGKMSQSGRDYWEHTHLRKYMPYMSGAGYVLSSDLVHVVIGIEQRTETNDWLFEFGKDDITIGFWLMSLDIRRINHTGVITSNQGCCFHLAQDVATEHGDNSLALTSIMQHASVAARVRSVVDICQQNWLVLSPVQQPEEVSYIDQSLQQCQRLEKLQDMAIEIAVRGAKSCQPWLPHGKVSPVSYSGCLLWCLQSSAQTCMSLCIVLQSTL